MYDLHSAGGSECHQASGSKTERYGRTLRIRLNQCSEAQRRIFTPLPYHTRKWHKTYVGRNVQKRFFSRLDHDSGFEQHTIRGQRKMQLHLELATVVMLAMTVGHIKNAQPRRLRSLVQPLEFRDTG